MPHTLDNPAWTALLSGNEELGLGTETARAFYPEISPFAGMAEYTIANFELLHQLIDHQQPVLLVSASEIPVAPGWQMLHLIKGYQMVFEGGPMPVDGTIKAVPLTDAHIPQMLQLTKLTNPGPFSARTIEFGHYLGIFDHDQLVAMAGQRLHAHNFAEISAVCTHPGYLGRGYARALLILQINRIVAAGETPFLHVKNDNLRAISVYQHLGFNSRTNVFFYVLKKA